jgi:hypothetical protein
LHYYCIYPAEKSIENLIISVNRKWTVFGPVYQSSSKTCETGTRIKSFNTSMIEITLKFISIQDHMTAG